MAKANSARRRSREVVARVAGQSGIDISAPDLVAKLLREHWTAFYDDKDVARDLIGIALSDIVRDVIAKQVGLYEDEDGPQMRLDLWSVGERSIAAEIGLMRAFVPSREAHIALYDPARITPEEVAEAGHYLIGHGQGCIKRGNGLLLLSRRRAAHRPGLRVVRRPGDGSRPAA